MKIGSLLKGTMKSGFTAAEESGTKISACSYLLDINANHRETLTLGRLICKFG